MKETIDLTKYRRDFPAFFEKVTGYSPILEQERLLRDLEDLSKRNILICSGRGMGKSFVDAVVALIYIYVLAKTENLGRGAKVYIISGSQSQSDQLFNHCRDLIERNSFLRDELRRKGKTRETTVDSIELKDGSGIYSLPPTSTKIRSVHGDLLIVDEACEDKADKVMSMSQAIPITSKIPRWIYSSTPHGRDNLQFKRWIIDLKKNRMSYYHWNINDIWIDQELRDQMIEKYGGKDTKEARIELFADTSVDEKDFCVFEVKDIDRAKRSTPALPEGGDIIAGIDFSKVQDQSKNAMVVIERVGTKDKVVWCKRWNDATLMPDLFSEIGKVVQQMKVSKINYDYYPVGMDDYLQKVVPTYVKLCPIFMKGKKGMMIGTLARKFKDSRIELYSSPNMWELIIDLNKYYTTMRLGDDLVDALALASYEEPKFDIEIPRKDDFKTIMDACREANKELSGEQKINKIYVSGGFHSGPSP
ncbi:hypothetical protein A3K70_01665 [Candidatus Bathyarchaeota archaeon RBG_16_48_13]|nr:MAG: hypothetical protein A3K70_01665 [Candidatus Bathyarchaeota archaeon RBG_16_48_13]